MALIPVVLCGGSGTRLWPLSRRHHPKQVLSLGGPDSLLQQTLRRARQVAPDATPVVVCNEEHRFLVAAQAQELGVKVAIVLEPEGRNTAPAAALAALLPGMPPHAQLLVLPADHRIEDVDAFVQAVRQGQPPADDGHLVVFGVTPDRPHTGYGYILRGAPLGDAHRVERFVEKPAPAQAEAYLRDGGYCWNSGVFLFRADAYLRELSAYAPQVLEACRQAMRAASHDLDFIRPQRDAFLRCPADSIDYAVMERTRRAAVVPLAARWSDLGSWEALYDALPKDPAGNAVVGDALLEDCERCLVYADGRLVGALGLRDQAIVETGDALLVMPLGDGQQVGKLVQRLVEQGRGESDLHRRVFRPWGSYEGVDQGPGFQVKRLMVNPGAQLSLQMHRYRAEHWIVVQGVARVTRGDEVFELRANESAFIPMGTRHRIENRESEPLHIIEVQSGAYLGEDDIIRYEDRYGRAELLQGL